MGQKLNKTWEWDWERESTRMGMGMTPIPMGIDPINGCGKLL